MAIDYQKYLKGITVDQCDSMIQSIIDIPVSFSPSGIYSLVVMTLKVVGIGILESKKKDRLSMEVLIEKQIADQQAHHDADDDVIIPT